MQQYALFGNPISHSVSPQLHAQFSLQCNIKINYQKIAVPLDQFKNAVDHFRAIGGLGANVTAPFKTHAFEYVDQLTERAKASGTVNTFIFKNTICVGDNTDGIGLIRDLHQNNIALRDKTILILGAGGAARGILPSMIDEKPRDIFIYNRTEQHAQALINYFKINFFNNTKKYDVILNALQMDFQKNFLLDVMHDNTVFYDLNYGARHESFYQFAKTCNATKIFDGLGMLIEQGAESFYRWFGIMPDTALVRRNLAQRCTIL